MSWVSKLGGGEDALKEVIGEMKNAINCIYKTNKMQNVQYVGC